MPIGVQLRPSIFALMFSQIALGGEMVSRIRILEKRAHPQQEGMSQYYDIPIVSLRNVVLHEALQNVTLVQDLFVNREPPVGDSLDEVDLRHVRLCS